MGGPSASIVRIDNGCPVLVAGDLPSVLTAIGDVLGAEDLAVLGGELYAAVDGGGEAHGNAAQPSGVYGVHQDGTSELVADLSAWVRETQRVHSTGLRSRRRWLQPRRRRGGGRSLGRQSQQRRDHKRHAGRSDDARRRSFSWRSPGPDRSSGRSERRCLRRQL